ncbi:unnamed protein product, partial [Sphacelaria rigidula]
MQGWAKGLKDRAERAATQLSQVSTAFIPPEEGADGHDATSTNGEPAYGLSDAGGVADITGGGSDAGASDAGGGSGGTPTKGTPTKKSLQAATQDELMVLVKHQASRLKIVEEEYGKLKQKYIGTFQEQTDMQETVQELKRALNQVQCRSTSSPLASGELSTTSGSDGGAAFDRLMEERRQAQDSAKEMAERYTALQEKFRALEGNADGGQKSAEEYANLLEKMKTLVGKYREAQGSIKGLQAQVEELRTQQVTPATDGDNSGGGGDAGGADPAFGATIAALQEKLREVSQARDDAEKRAVVVGGSGGGGGGRGKSSSHGEDWDTRERGYKEALEEKEAQHAKLLQKFKQMVTHLRNLQEEKAQLEQRQQQQEAGAQVRGAQSVAVDDDSGASSGASTTAEETEELRKQLAKSRTDNDKLSSNLSELLQKYRGLLAQGQGAAVENASRHDEEADSAASSSSDSGHRLADAVRELAEAKETEAALHSRCVEAEAALESTTTSLNDALMRLADLEALPSSADGGASAATAREEAGRHQEELRAENQGLKERIQDLAKELEISRETERKATSKLVAENAKTEELMERMKVRTAELEASAAASREEGQRAATRVAELEDQLATASEGGSEQLMQLQAQLQEALRERESGIKELETGRAKHREAEQALQVELESLRRSASELSEALEESRARESEVQKDADGLTKQLALEKNNMEERAAALQQEISAVQEANDALSKEATNVAGRLSETLVDLKKQTDIAAESQAAETSARGDAEQARAEAHKLAERLAQSEAQRDSAVRGESEHVSTLQAQLSEAQDSVAAANREVTELRTLTASLKTALTEHQAAAERASDSDARALEVLQEAQTEKERLQDENARLVAAMSDKEQELTAAAAAAAATDEELATARQTVSQLEGQLSETTRAAEAAATEMEGAKAAAVGDLSAKLEELQDAKSAEVSALQGQLSDAVAAGTAAEGAAGEANAEVGRLRDEVEELKGQLAATEARVAEAASASE